MSQAPKLSSRDIRAGDRFGQWEVIEPDAGREIGSRHVRLALCRCSCGTVAKVRAATLTSRGPECCIACCLKGRRQHDDLIPNTKLRQKWVNCRRNILRRIDDPTCDRHYLYGGRGITVCAEWREDVRAFLTFIIAQPGYDRAGMTIDRKDSDGPYSPENCRLASRKSQQRNRRMSPMVEHQGERMSAADFRERFAPLMSERVVYHHVHNGKSPEWIIDRNTRKAKRQGL